MRFRRLDQLAQGQGADEGQPLPGQGQGDAADVRGGEGHDAVEADGVDDDVDVDEGRGGSAGCPSDRRRKYTGRRPSSKKHRKNVVLERATTRSTSPSSRLPRSHRA